MLDPFFSLIACLASTEMEVNIRSRPSILDAINRFSRFFLLFFAFSTLDLVWPGLIADSYSQLDRLRYDDFVLFLHKYHWYKKNETINPFISPGP